MQGGAAPAEATRPEVRPGEDAGPSSRRRLVTVLVAAGAGFVVAAGILAAALVGDADRGDRRDRGDVVKAPLITDPSVAPLPLDETPEDFVAALGAAASAGDVAWLTSRLHPAVLQRYGEEACLDYVTDYVVEPGVRLRAAAVAGPGTWVWESDGRSTDVDEVYRVDAHRFSGGVETTGSIEAGNVDGALHYFADCGSPRR